MRKQYAKKEEIIVKKTTKLIYFHGYLTVYLSLILSLFLCVILTLVEGARINTMKLSLECAADAGQNSILAEYHRELLEQYDLLFVDISYGTGKGSINNTEEHLRHYIDGNLRVGNQIGRKASDWLALSVHQIEIQEFMLATDDSGRVMRRQAISYQKEKGLMGLITGIAEQLNQADQLDVEQENLKSRREQNKREINSIELPVEINQDGKEVRLELNNPADRVEQYRGIGILSLVLEDTGGLSSAAIYPQDYVTGRSLKHGTFPLQAGDEADSPTDKMLFLQYLTDQFGCYIMPLEKSLFQYQQEYLMAGKDVDWKNLESVVNRILLWREAANAAYLFSDQAKVAQARAAAYGLTAVAQVPALAEPVTKSILFGWAYLESISDAKRLLKGGKVPLIKTAAGWKTDIEDLLGFGGSIEAGSGEEAGLGYEEYLALMLFLEKDSKVTMRAMDLMEMDIRRTKGNREFCMDSCLDLFTAEVTIGSEYGYTFDIRRTSGYE